MEQGQRRPCLRLRGLLLSQKAFMETETKQPAIDNRLRRYANWGIVLSAGLWACNVVGFPVYHSLRFTTADNSWLLQIIAKR